MNFLLKITTVLVLQSCSPTIADKEDVSAAENKNSMLTAEVSNPAVKNLCLSYKFTKKNPIAFRVKKEHIYVGDGKVIFKFDSKGLLLTTINLPKTLPGFVDFDLFESADKTFFYTLYNGDVSCFKENGDVVYTVGRFGNTIKVDTKGYVYSSYQIYDKEKDQIQNKVRVITPNGTNFDYPTKHDLGTLNIEIVDSDIIFHVADKQVYRLPMDSSQSEKLTLIPELAGEPVWFLGKTENNYVLKTFDQHTKKDVLHFYDKNFGKIKSEPLNVSFEEIVREQRDDPDFTLDNPSCNLYSYFDSKLFYLRNTAKGSCISQVGFEN